MNGRRSTTARTIAHLPAEDRPRRLLQGSAVGWYGDTGDRRVTEDAPAGNGFLTDVCRVWEAAARPAELHQRRPGGRRAVVNDPLIVALDESQAPASRRPWSQYRPCPYSGAAKQPATA